MSNIQSQLEFLKRILPSHGLYASGYRHERKWRDTVTLDFQGIVNNCNSYSEEGYNTYFGLASYQTGWHYVPARDKNMFRTQNNALNAKALWLDIDAAKERSTYATQQEALTSLASFCRAYLLPTPLIVSSGQGLHVFWPFTQELPIKEWRLCAAALKALTVHYKLADVDHQRTTDSSGSPRLPGTMNYGKDGVAREVKILLQGTDCPPRYLAQRLVEQVKKHNLSITPPSEAKDDDPFNFSAVVGVPTQEQPKWMDNYAEVLRDPRNILHKCKQISGAGTDIYPVWRNMMLVMKHCLKGREVTHILSKQDARYTPEETDEVFSAVAGSGFGPATCAKFQEVSPFGCDGCPYKGKITTPLLLGEAAVEKKVLEIPRPTFEPEKLETTVIPNAPTIRVEAFSNGVFSVVPGQGVIWHKKEQIQTADGEIAYQTTDIIINETCIYIHSVCIDDTQPGQAQRSYVIRKESPGRVPVDIMFPIEDALAGVQMTKWLGHNGMLPVNPKYNKQMQDFMSTYLAVMQNRALQIRVRDSFGWTTLPDPVTGAEKDAFLIGDTVYTTGAPVVTKLTDRCQQLAKREYVQDGTLEEWKKIANIYTTLNEKAAQLIMCASFAAPFMKFGVGTATNAIINLWDAKGGRGKSTLGQVFNSVWGHPETLMMGANDTPSARYRTLATRKNLPSCMDEMTMTQSDQLVEFLYNVANGQEKRKSNSAGTALAVTGSWDTVTFMTSNRSVYEEVKNYSVHASAPAMRVIDIECDFKDYSGTPTGDYLEETLSMLKFNYGTAGRLFIQRCFETPDVFKNLTRQAMLWDKKHRVHSDERFWTYSLGLFLEAGKLAVQFGILNYDIEALSKYCKDLLVKLRKNKDEGYETAQGILVDFLNRNIKNMLIVQHSTRPASMPESLDRSLDKYIIRLPIHELTIRVEKDVEKIYISGQALREWLKRYNISTKVFDAMLIEDGLIHNADKLQYPIGKGVASLEDNGRPRCYCIEAKQLNYEVPTEPEKEFDDVL